jgi:hypothetical protein
MIGEDSPTQIEALKIVRRIIDRHEPLDEEAKLEVMKNVHRGLYSSGKEFPFTDGLTTPPSSTEYGYGLIKTEDTINYDRLRDLIDRLQREHEKAEASLTTWPPGIPVIVIPTGEKVEDLQELVETALYDLNIMCKIFDDELSQVSTSCSYIEGYGAIFLMDIPYSLIGRLETTRGATTTRPTLGATTTQQTGRATTTQQTGRPTTTQPISGATTTRPSIEKAVQAIDEKWGKIEQRLYGAKRQIDSIQERLEEDKISRLKTHIMKMLRHAVNIRCLEPDEWIVVTMTIRPDVLSDLIGDPFSLRAPNIKIADTPSVAGLFGDVPDTKLTTSSSSSDRNAEIKTTDSLFHMGLVVTLRVKKSDIDAFVDGVLNQDQFHKKVINVKYGNHGTGTKRK